MFCNERSSVLKSVVLLLIVCVRRQHCSDDKQKFEAFWKVLSELMKYSYCGNY